MMLNSVSNENYMNERIDTRRFALCLMRKLWIIVLTVVLGAIIGAAGYTLYNKITDGKPVYQIKSEYYIQFNEKDYPNGMDYYNAFTWNQFVTDDRIMEYALANVKGNVSEADIRESVSVLMISDYRILTVLVKNTDIDKMNAINEVYKTAMPYFADSLGEISSIELWASRDMEIANTHEYTKNAAFLGAIIAFVLAAFGWSVYYCLDDRIYVENDWKRCDSTITCLGYDCDMYADDTAANRAAVVGDAKVIDIADTKKLEDIKASDGVVLMIPWGKKNSTAIRYEIELLKKQNIKIFGAVITNVNEKFLKAYYGFSKKQ